MGAEPSRTDGLEPVVFGASFEALLAMTRPRLDPATLERIRAVGVDPGKPLLAAYPVQVWFALMEVLVSQLYPGEPRATGYHRLGQDYIRGQSHTLVGRALMGLARVVGPKRLLQRMSRNFRSSNNYFAGTLLELKAGVLELSVEVIPELRARMPPHTIPPEYLGGIVHEMMQVCGATRAKVAITPPPLPAGVAAVYRIELSPG